MHLNPNYKFERGLLSKVSQNNTVADCVTPGLQVAVFLEIASTMEVYMAINVLYLCEEGGKTTRVTFYPHKRAQKGKCQSP